MSGRAGTYATGESADGEVGEKSKALKTQLRRLIRKLAFHAPLTGDWFQMLEGLQRVASIAFTESSTGGADSGEAETNALLVGVDAANLTLWEQNQITVRLLLEEGKLNLCVRLLEDYKSFMRQATIQELLRHPGVAALGLDETALGVKCQLFEQSLGVLVMCALKSVEAVQTCDLPLLVSHMAAVMRTAVETDKFHADKGIDWVQENIVFSYLAAIGTHIEQIDTNRTLDLLLQSEVMPLVVRHMDKHGGSLRPASVQTAAEALASVMNAEEFDGRREDFFPNEADQELLVAVYEKYWKPLVSELDVRRKLQPLIDSYRFFQ